MNWKGFGRKWLWPDFKVLSQNLPEGTKEKHVIPPSGQLVSGPRFETWTSQI
jgi:hypothetical protein